MKVTGVSDTPSRRRIFTCHPTSPAQERACATDILRRLATQAYRGPVRDDLNDLLNFYTQARNDGGDFEEGIRFGIQGILANPRFMFRVEQAPAAATTSNDTYRSDGPRSGVAAFVLPLGHAARSGTAEGGR